MQVVIYNVCAGQMGKVLSDHSEHVDYASESAKLRAIFALADCISPFMSLSSANTRLVGSERSTSFVFVRTFALP